MIRDPWRTSPRGVAVTIVGVGSVVGLVGWPRETAYALSALAGLLALVGGVLKLRGELETREPAEAPADQPDGERCCVCGGPDTPYENYRGQLFCWPCANCPCGQVPCVRTGINDPAVSADAAGRCAGCPGCGGPDCIQRPDDLTAQEARDLVDDLGLQLYRAQDALAFVAEMCDIADEHRGRRGQPATVTTARVREWLKGAQCARQAGLVLDPDALRNRIAAALLARIKQAVITDATPFGPGPVSTLIAATEYDLADTALAELAPELERLRKAERAADLLADARRRAEEAEATLARVRDLHRKANNGDTCVYCAHGQRLGYDTTWPCDTIRALNTAVPAAPAEESTR